MRWFKLPPRAINSILDAIDAQTRTLDAHTRTLDLQSVRIKNLEDTVRELRNAKASGNA